MPHRLLPKGGRGCDFHGVIIKTRNTAPLCWMWDPDEMLLGILYWLLWWARRLRKRSHFDRGWHLRCVRTTRLDIYQGRKRQKKTKKTKKKRGGKEKKEKKKEQENRNHLTQNLCSSKYLYRPTVLLKLSHSRKGFPMQQFIICSVSLLLQVQVRRFEIFDSHPIYHAEFTLSKRTPNLAVQNRAFGSFTEAKCTGAPKCCPTKIEVLVETEMKR